MRELHVVAVSEDGRHIVLAGTAGASKGGFLVALDERLTAAVRGDLARPGELEPKGGDLTPKDIQTRLRAGESAERIAMSAGVPVMRVERFSGPVRGEMARIIDAVRSTHLVRGRRGRSLLPLGAAVDGALVQAGSRGAEDLDWATFREEEGTWVVTVSWSSRTRARSASWRYDPSAKTITGVDPASAALAHVDGSDPAPRAPRRTPKPPRASAAKAAASKTAAAKAAASKPAAAKAAASSKTAAAKAASKPAAAKPTTGKVAAKTPAVKTPRAAAPTAPRAAPAVPATPVERRGAGGARTAKAPPPTARRTKTTAARQGPTLRVVPNPTSAGSARAKAKKASPTAEQRDGVRARASVPGWADVLLGTSPRADPPGNS